jgi:hypothetical protein
MTWWMAVSYRIDGVMTKGEFICLGVIVNAGSKETKETRPFVRGSIVIYM